MVRPSSTMVVVYAYGLFAISPSRVPGTASDSFRVIPSLCEADTADDVPHGAPRDTAPAILL